MNCINTTIIAFLFEIVKFKFKSVYSGGSEETVFSLTNIYNIFMIICRMRVIIPKMRLID